MKTKHIDNGGSRTGVLGHLPASKTRRRVLKFPVPERPVVYVCKISRRAPELFFYIEEMSRFYIMGRGRKSLINQSERRAISSRGQSERGTPTVYFFKPNREIKKIFVPEQAFDFMKNMNPQQLVDFLLPNDEDWHVKTSSEAN